jgi:hypothetical protein
MCNGIFSRWNLVCQNEIRFQPRHLIDRYFGTTIQFHRYVGDVRLEAARISIPSKFFISFRKTEHTVITN